MSQVIVDALSILLIIGYALPLVYLSLKNLHVSSLIQIDGKEKHSFSIIIPYRNEAERIEACLQSLSLINYSRENVEIIFVNDHSEDSGGEMIEKWRNGSKWNTTHINLPEKSTGKKAGIRYGAGFSQFNYLITLDADCEVNPEWLFAFDNHLNRHEEAILIAAPVMIKEKKSILNYIESLDFAAMVSFGALTMKMGNSTIANGANLCTRKKEFIQSLGQLNEALTPSGDDVFLLHSLKQINNKEIYFLQHPSSLVLTHGVRNLKDFLAQKIRWASKAKFYKDKSTIYASIWLILAQFVTIICIYLLFFDYKWDFSLLFAGLCLKMFAEVILVYPLLKASKRRSLYLMILPFQVFYPIYISGIAILAQFFSFHWKGRRYK